MDCRTVIVVDEDYMVGTEDLKTLLAAAAAVPKPRWSGTLTTWRP
jgi:hypothetical protein